MRGCALFTSSLLLGSHPHAARGYRPASGCTAVRKTNRTHARARGTQPDGTYDEEPARELARGRRAEEASILVLRIGGDRARLEHKGTSEPSSQALPPSPGLEAVPNSTLRPLRHEHDGFGIIALNSIEDGVELVEVMQHKAEARGP